MDADKQQDKVKEGEKLIQEREREREENLAAREPGTETHTPERCGCPSANHVCQ